MWQYDSGDKLNHWIGPETGRLLTPIDGWQPRRRDKPFCETCKGAIGYTKAAVLTLLGGEDGTRESKNDV